MKKIILLSFLYLNLYAQELDIQSVEIIDTVIQTKIIEPLRLQGAPQTIQVLDAKTLEKRQQPIRAITLL